MISVIVPVYNVKKYLPECIESVLTQTYDNLELILIDDASTDGSGLLCDRYAEGDRRIKVLHREQNGGLSGARNLGLDIACGDYVTFIDSDDIVTREYLSVLLDYMNKEDADIVSSPLKRFADGEKIIGGRREKGNEVLLYTGEEAVRKTLYQTESINCSACAKLYKRNLWEEIRFRQGILYEDLDVFYKAFFAARKIVHIPDYIYYYRRNQGSILGVFNKKRADVIGVTEKIMSYMAANNPSLLPAAHDRCLSAAFNILVLMKRNSFHNEELRERCKSTIKSYRWESLKNPEVRLKNKIGILASYLLFDLL